MLPAPLCHIQQDQNLQQASQSCHLLLLPYECLLHILRFLSPVHLARLAMVSRELRSSTESCDLLWLSHCLASIDGASVYGIGDAHDINDPVSSDSSSSSSSSSSDSSGSSSDPLTHVAALQQCYFLIKARHLHGFRHLKDLYVKVALGFGSLLGLWQVDFPFFLGGIVEIKLELNPLPPVEDTTFSTSTLDQTARISTCNRVLSVRGNSVQVSETTLPNIVSLSLNRHITVDSTFTVHLIRTKLFEMVVGVDDDNCTLDVSGTAPLGSAVCSNMNAQQVFPKHNLSFDVRTGVPAVPPSEQSELTVDTGLIRHGTFISGFLLGVPDITTGLWPYPNQDLGSDTTLAHSWADIGIDLIIIPTGNELPQGSTLLHTQSTQSLSNMAIQSDSVSTHCPPTSRHVTVMSIDCAHGCFRKRIVTSSGTIHAEVEPATGSLQDLDYLPLCTRMLVQQAHDYLPYLPPKMPIRPDASKLWVGIYGNGYEVLMLQYTMSPSPYGVSPLAARPTPVTAELCVYKVTGDINVPRGEMSFKVILGDGTPTMTLGSGVHRQKLLDLPEYSGTQCVSYIGQATIAMRGYRAPTCIHCDVVFFSDSEMQVYWEPLNKISRFRRLDSL
ncbi:hypothetical protein BASA61_005041 [Batrachochytrium salamandrivorans]|nr:hypothetical protein BASA61_005041 [Batrachochytrium salamandrivorans]